jgi:hypothetical protein
MAQAFKSPPGRLDSDRMRRAKLSQYPTQAFQIAVPPPGTRVRIELEYGSVAGSPQARALTSRRRADSRPGDRQWRLINPAPFDKIKSRRAGGCAAPVCRITRRTGTPSSQPVKPGSTLACNEKPGERRRALRSTDVRQTFTEPDEAQTSRPAFRTACRPAW